MRPAHTGTLMSICMIVAQMEPKPAPSLKFVCICPPTNPYAAATSLMPKTIGAYLDRIPLRRNQRLLLRPAWRGYLGHPEGRSPLLWPLASCAHPPCERWGRFARGSMTKQVHQVGDDSGCFASALANLQRCGGVLEHPAHSKAWGAFRLKKPGQAGWTYDDRNGLWVCEVEQGHYDAWGKDAEARIAELEAENAALASIAEDHVNTAHRYRDELEIIANTDWRKWDSGMNNPEDFVAWAQNRARHALNP